MAAPTITTISPLNGSIGILVSIVGTGLASATSLTFNSISAIPVSNTDTLITVKVPVGATTGAVAITTAGGTVSSTAPFFIEAALPSQYTFGTTGLGEYQMLAPTSFKSLTPAVRTDPWAPISPAQVELNRELALYAFNPPVDPTPLA